MLVIFVVKVWLHHQQLNHIKVLQKWPFCRQHDHTTATKKSFICGPCELGLNFSYTGKVVQGQRQLNQFGYY